MFFIVSFNGFYILEEESNFVNCSSFLKRVEGIFEFEMIILCFSVAMKDVERGNRVLIRK